MWWYAYAIFGHRLKFCLQKRNTWKSKKNTLLNLKKNVPCMGLGILCKCSITICIKLLRLLADVTFGRAPSQASTTGSYSGSRVGGRPPSRHLFQLKGQGGTNRMDQNRIRGNIFATCLYKRHLCECNFTCFDFNQ